MTFLECRMARGLGRRDFLRFCAAAAAWMGLDQAVVPTIARALATKPRPPVIWRHFQECTGCTETLLRSVEPSVADLILDLVSLEYHETLLACAGRQAEALAAQAVQRYAGEYLLCVEGSLPSEETHCLVGGRRARAVLEEEAAGARAVLAVGSCASWGGVQGCRPNPTGARGVPDVLGGRPVVRVPGCPPVPEVLAGVLVYLVTFGTLPPLDEKGRPSAFFAQTVHEQCPRRGHFEEGRFAESFGDDGYRSGWCLYPLGCRGLATYNACTRLRWNAGVSSCVQAGHPCLGCANLPGSWDEAPLYVAAPGTLPESASCRRPAAPLTVARRG
ncbi:MAG: hydrogenase small subunit [Bacillota bacterium]